MHDFVTITQIEDFSPNISLLMQERPVSVPHNSRALLRIRLTDSIKRVKLKEIYWVAVHQGLYETERRGVNGLAQRWILIPTTSWLIELNVHVTSRIPLIVERCCGSLFIYSFLSSRIIQKINIQCQLCGGVRVLSSTRRNVKSDSDAENRIPHAENMTDAI